MFYCKISDLNTASKHTDGVMFRNYSFQLTESMALRGAP